MRIDFTPLGIIRRIDDLGRICLPKECRLAAGIEDGEAFELFCNQNGDFYVKRIKRDKGGR